jgi:hypothetical protein
MQRSNSNQRENDSAEFEALIDLLASDGLEEAQPPPQSQTPRGLKNSAGKLDFDRIHSLFTSLSHDSHHAVLSQSISSGLERTPQSVALEARADALDVVNPVRS